LQICKLFTPYFKFEILSNEPRKTVTEKTNATISSTTLSVNKEQKNSARNNTLKKRIEIRGKGGRTKYQFHLNQRNENFTTQKKNNGNPPQQNSTKLKKGRNTIFRKVFDFHKIRK
jgi:hypothetical protein